MTGVMFGMDNYLTFNGKSDIIICPNDNEDTKEVKNEKNAMKSFIMKKLYLMKISLKILEVKMKNFFL